MSSSTLKPPQKRICRSCGIWKLGNDDVYCSYCGARVAKLEVSLLDDTVYFSDQGAVAELILLVNNTGQTDITIDELRSDDEWIVTKDVALPIEVPTGTKLNVPIKVELYQPVGYYSSSIRLKTNFEAHTLPVNVLPKPRVLFYMEGLKGPIELGSSTSQEIVLISDAQAKKQTYPCYLEVQSSIVTVEAINITAIEPRYVEEGPLQISGLPNLPVTLDPPSIGKLKFSIEVDPQKLQYGENRFSIGLKCLRIKEPITGSFSLVHRSAPKIEFLGAYGDKLYLPEEFFVRSKDDIAELKINVVNSGGLSVKAEAISGDDIVCSIVGSSFMLEPKQVQSIALKLKIGSLIGTLDKATTIQISLVLKLKCIEYPDYYIPDEKLDIFIKVSLMPEYEGIIAIDFGTTNSCCAVEGAMQKSLMVPLAKIDADSSDVSEAETLLPSVIFYIDQHDDDFEYIVGEKALTFSHMPDTNPSTVHSVKRKLGQREPIPVVLDATKRRVDLPPELIAGHIIKRIIEYTEKFLNRRIVRCVITHPARFYRPQIMALERAFQEVCGVEVVAIVNEAVAAAVDAILTQGGTERSDYTVMVYDFGGGTTDIALLRVRDVIREDGLREILPETLGVDGKRRLGGDDVTERLSRLVLKKCAEELKRIGAPKILWNDETDSDWTTKPDLSSDQQRNAANANMLNILLLSEEHKKRLSNGGSPTLSVFLHCKDDDKVGSYTFQIRVTEDEMNALIESDIRDAMKLASDLVKMANQRDNLNIKHPDIIVLAGMSSRLPIVKKVAREFFPNSEIKLHPDLKACVARGAYTIYAISQFPAMISVDTSLLKTPPPTSAQYGIMVYGTHGELIFKSAIPKGARLPAEGVISGFKIGRKTSITVYENPGTSISDPDIRKIAVCRLNVPDSISDEELRNAKVFMRLEDEMKLKVILRVGDMSYEFNAEVQPYV